MRCPKSINPIPETTSISVSSTHSTKSSSYRQRILVWVLQEILKHSPPFLHHQPHPNEPCRSTAYWIIGSSVTICTQGSCLGPILDNLFMVKLSLYVGDNAFYSFYKNLFTIQNHLQLYVILPLLLVAPRFSEHTSSCPPVTKKPQIYKIL